MEAKFYTTEDGIDLNREQEEAYKKIAGSSMNFFVTGKAGTGKSVLLKYCVKNLKKYLNKNIAVLAPTGIAALNIEGQTIHSFFGLSPQLQNISDADISRQQKKLLKSVDIIIIDEISMVRCDVMDMIDAKLKIAKESDRPFGGCQMILFGDLYQLPPVLGKDENETKYILESYGSEFFFAAPAIQDNPFSIIELRTVHRQKEQKFIENLNRLRTGDNSSQIIDFFNKRVKNPSDMDGIITLTAKKNAADRVNQTMLKNIVGEEYIFHGVVEGDFPNDESPTDNELRLKVGAQVMMLKNDKNKKWVNGTIAKISRLGSDYIEVNVDGHLYSVDTESWIRYKFVYDESTNRFEQIAVGTFTQFPVKLAYAVTIHKSQGKTYEKVIIDYSLGRAFSAGQTYVALSRCRALDGLYLSVPLVAEDITPHKDVVNYLSGTFHTEVKRLSVKRLSNNDFTGIKWLEDNRIQITTNKTPKKITGTRLAAIFGLDKYKTPFELWCNITHTYEKPFESNQFTNAGKVVEKKQIEYVKNVFGSMFCEVMLPDEEYGKNSKENMGFDFFKGTEIFGGMWDSVLKECGETTAVFEMKTTSAKRRGDWQNDAPLQYLLQGALYSYLMGLDNFYVVVSFIEGREYYHPEYYECRTYNTQIMHYRISDLFPDFENEYIRPAIRWWSNHVETGISPEYDPIKDSEIINALKEISQ